MSRLKDKVALITGAGSGMGKADALRLSAEGAKVMLTDINLDAVQAVADEIGNTACAISHDVSNEQQWQDVISATADTFGGLNILVNSAGILQFCDVVNTSLEMWEQMHRVNSIGPFLGCKHSIPLMTDSGGGSIINMSSIASKQGMSFAAAYSSSKGSVEALTRSVAMYCKQQENRIRCNSIHPDGVITPMVGEVTFGTRELSQEQIDMLSSYMAFPEEIAGLITYLASDEARFINGASFLVDNASSITPPLGV